MLAIIAFPLLNSDYYWKMENILEFLNQEKSLRSVSKIPLNIELTVGRRKGVASEAGSCAHVHACLLTQKARQKPKEPVLAENIQLGSRNRHDDSILGSA